MTGNTPNQPNNDNKPEMVSNLGKVNVPVWKPQVTLKQGETVIFSLSCPHKTYGHEREDTAQKCLNGLIETLKANLDK